jgi:two-component system, sensor histidine kinase and response regulator
MRILVIDDDVMILRLVKGMLVRVGHEVLTAPDGESGLRLAHTERPDMVLCDILMPGLSGFDVLCALRASAATSVIPLIFLTGDPRATHLREDVGLGGDDFLLKPFTREELLDVIEARSARLSHLKREVQGRLDGLRSALAPAIPADILSPLTTLVGLTVLLRDEGAALPPEMIATVSRDITQEGERLQGLVRRCLMFAKLERLARIPDAVELLRGHRTQDACQMTEDVARQTAVRHAREADLVFRGDGPALRIRDTHLRFLVDELTENAFRFSRAGQAVQVTLDATDGGSGRLSVRDLGPGLPADVRSELAGSDGPWGARDSHRGTALGLAIVRRITVLYGHELRLANQGSAGTQIDVTFRRPAPA